MSNKKAIVLLSGGLDSSTCLALAIEKYGNDSVFAVTAIYGQRHNKEVYCAKRLAGYYEVDWRTIDLIEIFRESRCALITESGEDVPIGSYADQKAGGGVKTYVPFRNGLLLSALASIAMTIDPDSSWRIQIGVHSDDSAGDAYPDCSEDFASLMSRAISLGTYGKVSVEAPFVALHKSDIVSIGTRLGVPYELTWSCYNGGEKQCGKCATCIDRREAFRLNGVIDPVPYEV